MIEASRRHHNTIRPHVLRSLALISLSKIVQVCWYRKSKLVGTTLSQEWKQNMRRSLLFSCLALSAFVPTVAYAYQSCDQAPRLSPASSLPITMTFHNISTETLELDWIDFKGGLKSYGMVGPGETKTQSTFEGHVWQWTNASGECINRYVAGRQNVK